MSDSQYDPFADIDAKSDSAALQTGEIGGQNEDSPEHINVKFERNTHLALDKASEILSKRLNPNDKNYPAELRAQAALANTQISAAVRVDETKIRIQHSRNLIPELMERMREEQRLVAADARPFGRIAIATEIDDPARDQLDE